MRSQTPTRRADRRWKFPRRTLVLGAQLALLLAVLAAWEYLPKLGDLGVRTHFLNPFFISSPSEVGSRIIDMLTGRNSSPAIWTYAAPTLYAAVLGTAIGMSLGGLFGLLLSNFEFLADVINPYMAALNAVPRVVLIPLVVILFGTGTEANVVIATMVTFFVAFFSAYEGGRSVAPHLLENATLLGANGFQRMLHIRSPYVLAWTLSVLPLGVTFAVVSVVTGEILTGSTGLGRLVAIATASVDSSLTFSVVVYTAAISLLILQIAGVFQRRVLHWWAK